MSVIRNRDCAPRISWRSALWGAAASLLASPEQAFAGGYWQGFEKYWSGFLGQADGVVMTVVLVGALGVFILLRGKWVK